MNVSRSPGLVWSFGRKNRGVSPPKQSPLSYILPKTVGVSAEGFIRTRECSTSKSIPYIEPIQDNGRCHDRAYYTPSTYANYSNMAQFMSKHNFKSVQSLYQWSVDEYPSYVPTMIQQLGIKVDHPYENVFEDISPFERRWLTGSRMNIVDSCLHHDSTKIALLESSETSQSIKKVTFAELESQVNTLANYLHETFEPGATISLIGPMDTGNVAAFLAIIKAGCVCAPIPHSYSKEQITSILDSIDAHAIIVGEAYQRNGKDVNVYKKLAEVPLPKLVLGHVHLIDSTDIRVDSLQKCASFKSILRDPNDVVFEIATSGTSGRGFKLISLSMIHVINYACLAFFHQNVQSGSITNWPTEMGWMMGPFATFGSFINGATMSVYRGATTTESFLEFLDKSAATSIGMIPSILLAFDRNGILDKWTETNRKLNHIQQVTITGERSDPMVLTKFLKLLPPNTPIIEIMGGTEVGVYATSSVLHPLLLSSFSMPAMGSRFGVHVDMTNDSEVEGEVFLRARDFGHSTKGKHFDHYAEYFEDAPMGWRRHGDRVNVNRDGYIQSIGRSDDSGNIGGIKVSALLIEHAVNQSPKVAESVAVFVSQKRGPDELLVVVVCGESVNTESPLELKDELNNLIKAVNPLIRLSYLNIVDHIPKTASGKLMRKPFKNSRQGWV